MIKQDATKARIKILENNMLGLIHRLKQMQTPSSAHTSTSAVFNARTKRDALNSLFENASQVQSIIAQQILAIRDELASLQAQSLYNHDFRLTA